MTYPTQAPPPVPKKKRYVLRVIGVLCAGIFLLLILSIAIVSFSTLRTFAIRTAVSVMGAAPKRDSSGLTNILLLGVGDKDHDAADLTDTMMIASIDSAKQSIVLLSIPRDLYLTGNKTLRNGRINTLYSSAKAQTRAKYKKMEEADVIQIAIRDTAAEMSRKFEVEIHGVLIVDFTTVVEAVDALGGVDVVVSKDIVDYSYPVKEGVTGLFKLTKGPQHLDGETALKFARSRHSGTDFDRSVRQQQLIRALEEKVRSMNRFQQLGFVTSFYKSVTKHVQTNLKTVQLLGLAQLITSLSQENVLMMQINFNYGGDNADAKAGGFLYSADSAQYEGANVLLPVTTDKDPTGWKQIRTYVWFLLHHPEIYFSDSEVQTVDASNQSLAAYRLLNEIRRYGFVTVPSPKIKPPVPKTKVPLLENSYITYRERKDKPLAYFFKNYLNIQTVSTQKVSDTTGTGSVRIVIGKDFKYRPFQMIGTGAVEE